MTRDRQSYDDQEATQSIKNGPAVLAAETLRSASESPHTAEPARGDERISVFWRVFGGTILSIAALVVITVYNQFSSGQTDLRKELNQLYENRAELLRKDEFNTRLSSVWTSMKELQSGARNLTALNERAKLLEQQLERQAKNADDERKETQRKLEEQRKAAEDERKEMQRKLEDQRKLAETERGELVRQLQEQQRASTDERKDLVGKLEEQRRSFDQDRKELSRQIQVLSERLAKVEARKVVKAAAAKK